MALNTKIEGKKVKTSQVLELKTLTPLHIHNGTPGLDYLTRFDVYRNRKAGKLYKLDMEKVSSKMKEMGKLDSFLDAMMEDPSSFNLYDFLKNLPKDERKKLDKVEEFVLWHSSIRDDKFFKTNAKVAIFMRDAFLHPYIPGSSLKGSLRTGFLFSLTNETDVKKP